MKKLLFIVALVIVQSSYGQNSINIVNSSLSRDTNIVFRGYNNLITIVPAKNDTATYTLTGTNCVISKTDGHGKELPENQYILKAGRDRIVNLSVHTVTSDGKLVEMHNEDYFVSNVPDAAIFINDVNAKEALPRNARLIEVKYAKEIPIEFQFDVAEWMMLIDGTIYTGTNNMITDEVKLVLRALPADTEVQVKVKAKGRTDSIIRTYEAIFTTE